MATQTVLILAGRRPDRGDPLAEALGISHKCVVPILGRPAIGYVAETVAQALPDAEILISIEREDVLAAVPTLAELRAEGRVKVLSARTTLLESVTAAGGEATFPLLITTADNVLLSTDAVSRITRAGEKGEAGAIVALARREAILAAHSSGKGRYYRFCDGSFSNCNLFWVRDRTALRAAAPFSTGGQFLKTKGRILKAFGPLNALMFATRLLSLKAMFASVSRRLKVNVEPFIMADGRLAIDVDDLQSLKMVEDILSRDSDASGQ